MEDSTNIDVSPIKIKKIKRSSVTETQSPDKKINPESGKIIQNGTGTGQDHSSDLDVVYERPRTVKITKITKIKREPKSPIKEVPSPSKRVASPEGSSSNQPTGEDFYGFDNVTVNKEQVKKQDALLKILGQLNGSCSSVKDELGKPTREETEESDNNKPEEEEMTVDTEHVSDTDSDQMEIDMGNEKDTSELSDKEKTKDSAVISAGNKVSKREGRAAQASGSQATSKGDGAKVEYCGVCSAEVNDAEEGICCDGDCERWFHLRCSGLSQAEYDELGLDENAKWACTKCSGKPRPQLAAEAKPLLTVRKDLVQTSTPSPSVKRRSVNREGRTPKVDISNPAFLKPFDFGWKRELVYRSTNDNQNRRQGDIYYYTPKGKKLRSLRELCDHLVGSDLTQDNFTFWKEPLGLDDPEKEIIRDAKYKMVNKEQNASPAAIVKKLPTPKAPKTPKVTPKVTPKLTATVTPLETSGALKASASVTPRVVFKGRSPSTTGPKFKVTPSKTSSPGQAQKIVITKDDESAQSCHNDKDSNGTSNPCLEEDIEMSTRNKFKRYGLLANAKTARKRVIELAFPTSTSINDGSTTLNSGKTPKTRSTHEFAEKRDLKVSNGPNAVAIISHQEKNREKSKGAKVSSSEKKKKTDLVKKQTKSSVISPLLYEPLTSDQIPFSLNPDRYNPQNLLSRPSPPEIQFRPSNPSSYGCQTSSSLVPHMSGSSTTLYQSNMTNSTNLHYETVFIVDSASSETYLTSQKSGASPLIINNSDCSIEIVSVESLRPNEHSSLLNGSNPNVAKRIMNSADIPRVSEMGSPISLRSSSPEAIVIEDDDLEDRLPPFLQRTSPPPNTSLNRSPPSLQRIPSPPSLLYKGSSTFPTPGYSKPPPLSVGSQSFNSVQKEINTGSQNLNSLQKEINTGSQNLNSQEEISTAGTSQLDYRKLKKERFLMRQKVRREMVKLKKSYLKEKKLFTKKKCQEKALQVKYLSLKVKNKELKMALLEKALEDARR